MAPSSRKNPTAAEVGLAPLKNCLVNLPPSLESLLVNANTAAQNVIIEIQYRSSSGSAQQSNSNSHQQSAYVGWTGMPSKRRIAPVVGREGISGVRGSSRDQDIAVVEVDSTFGRVLGLSDGQKIGVLLHIDPPVAHTVNIEPLTPADWEIIELHANFLEHNLLSQIRALPNPAYNNASQANGAESESMHHPLTLHLSPTSTANITVTSLTPAAPSTSPFAKISPDAEVIVAPKVRQSLSRGPRSENRSSSSGRKSQSGRSSASTVRPRSSHSESASRGAVFLRGVDRNIAQDWFEEDVDSQSNDGFRIWIDRDVLAKNELRGIVYASVAVVRPSGLMAPVDPQQQAQQKEQESSESGKVTRKLVARVYTWDDSPDSRHAALSSPLCSALGSEGMVGSLVRIDAAPPQTPKNAVKSMKIYPFITDLSKKKEGLRFGGDSTASREALAERLKVAYRASVSDTGLLAGPITDGMVLPKLDLSIMPLDFDGGLIRFDPPPSNSGEAGKTTTGWLIGSEFKMHLDIQPEVPRPNDLSHYTISSEQPIPREAPQMVGIDSVIEDCMSNLTRSSSILLTGGLGSGKSTLCQLLAQRLQRDYLFNVIYFPCRSLVGDDTRVSTIRDTVNRLFLSASWGTRLGGGSVVLLDDLDKLCPVETELQVGGENGRSRQISELICATIREYCSSSSSVVLLATAQGKDSLNNVVVGSHVVREIISLKAPDKDSRRQVLEKLTAEDRAAVPLEAAAGGHARNQSSSSQNSWLDPSNPGTRPGSSEEADGFVLGKDLDLLDLAGKSDGFMPGDLVLLVARAKNEALIRTVQDNTSATSTITLGSDDFARALKGFTPASLRNVTLTSSSTTFSAIGGLRGTRKTLLETLQYPTKYAPIFAQCPLRLRSGLLLYGFPGCGKTLLASAVAGECGLNFISVKGPEILNKYIGASEKSVRDLFERAEAARPCILFFDEFDSIAPKRGHDSTGVTDRVVNQLLTQMDGAEGLSGVYVLAATSRPDLIDPALLRPGRLDKSLLCDMPSHADRVDVIQTLAEKLKLSDDVAGRIDDVATRTEGYSGADLQAVVYNAHLEAIHDALDDRTSTTDSRLAKPKSTTHKPTVTVNGDTSSASKSFIQFLYSSEEHALAAESSRAGKSAALPPPAVVAAKLEELKNLRRRQRQLQRTSSGANGANNVDTTAGATDKDKDESSNDISIEWAHIERSLALTRCSISDVERRRLEDIYREFIMGRNGEMPTGEAGREIGGRTSLM